MKRLPSVSVMLASIICIAGFFLLQHVLTALHATKFIKSCFVIYSVGLMVVAFYLGLRTAERNQMSAPGKLKKLMDMHQTLINDIYQELPSSLLSEENFNTLIDHFLCLVFTLPAGKSSKDYLFYYSLLTASYSLKSFGTRSWRMETPEGTRDDEKTITMEDNWKLGVFISALLSNLGQIYEVEVHSKPEGCTAPDSDKEEIWDPRQETFYNFALRHREYTIRWKSSQKSFRRTSDNQWMQFLMKKYVIDDEEIINLVGEEVYPEVIDSLSLTPDPGNRIYPVVEMGKKLATDHLSRTFYEHF